MAIGGIFTLEQRQLIDRLTEIGLKVGENTQADGIAVILFEGKTAGGKYYFQNCAGMKPSCSARFFDYNPLSFSQKHLHDYDIVVPVFNAQREVVGYIIYMTNQRPKSCMSKYLLEYALTAHYLESIDLSSRV